MVTKLILVRHGKTNVQEDLQQPEDALSDVGKNQIRQTAERLKEITNDHVIYASPYARALESAKIIQAVTLPSVPIMQDKRLCEISTWTSPTQLHNPETSPEQYGHALAALAEGENRGLAFLEEISHKHSGEDVIIASHGNIIRALIATALKASIEVAVRLCINNASISILEYDTNAQEPFFRLTLLNDTGHLA